ncbi:FoF1 ATP synthase subunit delta/epsilon [Tenacibaculum amylolyticum]|uniref:FoF1 ATP synthase subunit delta/epsilon n=1 Tax=Tenacibaculum amylolyticum TaxID=104269 RepID=UPI003892E5D0
MFLEIVTPEAVIFSSEVSSVAVPGLNGEFQMLNNHAPVVSLLVSGKIRVEASNVSIDEKFQNRFTKENDGRLSFEINSGTLEMKDNKAIILAD